MYTKYLITIDEGDDHAYGNSVGVLNWLKLTWKTEVDKYGDIL